MVVVAMQCVPVSSVWDLGQENSRKCLDSNAFAYAGAGFSIFEDIFIVLLPVPELRKLQVTLPRKIGLVVVFAMGSL